MPDLTPWKGRSELERDEEAALLSRIPLLAGDSRKMDYLNWRATGFPVKQACELAGVSLKLVNRWRRNDEVFRLFESDRLPELQRLVGPDLLRLDFMRNFKLLLHTDAKIIMKGYKRLNGFQVQMDDQEWAYFRQIRSHYTPNDYLNLEKALAPEKHRERPVVIQLTFEGAPSEDESRDLYEPQDAVFRELPSGESLESSDL